MKNVIFSSGLTKETKKLQKKDKNITKRGQIIFMSN
jgi:hypothetical protein